MFYEPKAGHGLPHDPLKAIIAPRPIGWISTRSQGGAVNLAPYSFFNAFTTSPPLVWFSSEDAKDSATFAEQSGEFAVNLVSRHVAEQMNQTAIDAPRGVDEFELAGLTAIACTKIAAPRVAEAHAVLECVVTETFRPVDRFGKPSAAHVVAGEVVGVHISEDVLTDGLFDIVKAGTISRLGYMDYAQVTETFQMRRPRWKK